LLMPHFAIMILLSSSFPPWLHLPVAEPTDSVKERQW
jgi:hypothetical protein